MLIAVNYHYVRPVFDHAFPGIQGITPAELETQLRLLGSVSEFVTPAQVRAAVGGQAVLPKRAIVVTFDDGLREQFDWALPVLDRLGITALFFVNTGPIARCAVSTAHKIHLLSAHLSPGRLWTLLEAEAEKQGVAIGRNGHTRAAMARYPYDTSESADLKYLLNVVLKEPARDALVDPCFAAVFGDEAPVSRGLYFDVEQLRELGRRGMLGSHADEHVLLGRLPRAAVRDYVRASVQRLNEWTGQRAYALSYPYGTYESSSAVTGAAVADVGIEVAFTGERAGNPDLTCPRHLARFDCNDLPGGKRARFDIETLFDRVPAARWYR